MTRSGRSRLTPRQCQVLRLLEDGEWRTSRELADELGARSKASLTGLLRNLVAGGWLEEERVGSEHDWYAERRYRHVDHEPSVTDPLRTSDGTR